MHKIRYLKVGAEVRLTNGNFVLASVSGAGLKLRNTDTGEYTVIPVSEMPLALEEPPERTEVDARDVDLATEEERTYAELLAAHLEEMTRGTPLPGSGAQRPEYELRDSTASARLRTKSKELTALGMRMSEVTLKRKKALYNKHGVAGLIDRRELFKPMPLARADDRVLEALRVVLAKEKNKSTGSMERIAENVKEELLKRFPGQVVTVPSRTTLWRYVTYLAKGRYTLGNAANRRSKANAPDRMFESRPAIMPGHEVQIDSSPFDILVIDGTGRPTRAVLTIMVDKATRSIIANSVVLKASKGVDHALLLAKAVVPRPLRPGGEHFTKHELPVMPWVKLLEPEDAARYDAAQAFIVPQRIMVDNGADYISTVFRSACEQLGISITESSTYSPTDKAMVERTFHSIKTLFAQHLPGYTGGTVTNRGADPSKDADLLDIYTLTELFDRWVTIVWQNLRHDALRDPLESSVLHTPNSMYMAMFDLTGYVPIPLTADDYISLMPIEFRTIQADGIALGRRRYDSPLLHPYRLMESGDASRSGKWAVRYDPYNPGAVWIMDQDSGEWIECRWMNGDAFKKPFSRHIRSEAKRIVEDMGMAGDQSALRLTQDILASTRAARAQMEAEEERNRVAAHRDKLSGVPAPTRTAKTRSAKQNVSPKEAGLDTENSYMELGSFDMNEGAL
ncbi:Mu transposase C-terminal domain-containing protein [Cryobacterium aureum]|uniref:Mu transposase C-terminal domain-containing protein n=1 Tax=Cryobacterium aureum TaxID=995037 RepID=UPI000CF40A95|nr:Mu transposase C-terminal domain-containing protein [Cryobacterium aureum]